MIYSSIIWSLEPDTFLKSAVKFLSARREQLLIIGDFFAEAVGTFNKREEIPCGVAVIILGLDDEDAVTMVCIVLAWLHVLSLNGAWAVINGWRSGLK